MQDSKHFREIQYFYRQPILWVTLLAFLILILALYLQDTLITWVTVILILVWLAQFLLMFYSRLETVIDPEGIRIKLRPFVNNWKSYPWTLINDYEVRKYRAIGEFGGWGVRVGRNGRAFNISGDMGLEITLDDGRKVLIGTQRPDEVARIVGSFMKD